MRKEIIQTRELHLLFKANGPGLQKVYNFFQDRKTNEMTRKIVVYNIMFRVFDIPPDKARIIYSRSKMTISNEAVNKEYFEKLKYVEFLELICRIAKYKFSLCPEDKIELTFSEQVKVILEEFFQKLEKYGVTFIAPETNYMPESSDSEVDSENSESERSSIITKENIARNKTNLTILTNQNTSTRTAFNMIATETITKAEKFPVLSPPPTGFSRIESSSGLSKHPDTRKTPNILLKSGASQEDDDEDSDEGRGGYGEEDDE